LPPLPKTKIPLGIGPLGDADEQDQKQFMLAMDLPCVVVAGNVEGKEYEKCVIDHRTMCRASFENEAETWEGIFEEAKVRQIQIQV